MQQCWLFIGPHRIWLMQILYWESWPLTSLPLFLIFWLIIYSIETPWWDVPKPWEHNRTSGHGPAIHGVCWKTPIFPSGHSAQLQLPGFNNALQEGSQLCQWGRDNSCSPGTAQSFMPDPHKALEQPGKERRLSILTSAELGLSQTTARNFWSSISFSWGELELVPTETLPALPPAMPWGSHKEKGH